MVFHYLRMRFSSTYCATLDESVKHYQFKLEEKSISHGAAKVTQRNKVPQLRHLTHNSKKSHACAKLVMASVEHLLSIKEALRQSGRFVPSMRKRVLVFDNLGDLPNKPVT